METVLVYFDESGDDGFVNSSSNSFILTSVYMKAETWQKNYVAIKNCRALLKEKFGFHSTEELHTMHFLTDKGRVAPMRKTARAIRAYNPIQSHFSFGYNNQPITGLIEDILEKESSESYFIQVCDFISYFVNLYYKCVMNEESLPNRVANLINKDFVRKVLATLKYYDKLNLKASNSNDFGFVIYPKGLK